MHVIILDDYQDAVRKLKCANMLDGVAAKVYTNTVKGTGQLAVRLREAEALVLIGDRTHISRALLDKLPHLRLICQIGQVGAHIDVESCTQMGVAITETNESPIAQAELTWALIMTSARRLPQYIGNLKHGAWQQSGLKSAAMPANFGLGYRLAGKTLGLWGFDAVAQKIAVYAQAFGMPVLVHADTTENQWAAQQGLTVTTDQTTFLQSVDILSLHLPLNEQTRHSITASALNDMKPSSMLVNTAHAELFEENGLVQALNRGRPGFAAVDVFENEPIMQGHALMRLENSVCTPHIGQVEIERYEAVFQQAFTQLLAFINGEDLELINPAAKLVTRPQKTVGIHPLFAAQRKPNSLF